MENHDVARQPSDDFEMAEPVHGDTEVFTCD